MSSGTRLLGRSLTAGIMLLLVATVSAPREAIGASADDLHAGDVLRTVSVGLPAACLPSVGTSLAIVQGSKVDLPQYPILLVTSCFASGGSGSAKAKRASLYFLDPATGTVVKTIQTRLGTSVFAPGQGWAHLVLAPDKGVLFGCGDEGSVYSIDYSVFTAATDGTLTAVPKPAAAITCAGLAWDPSNNTLYETIGGTIFHFDITGSSPGFPASFPTPSGCIASGLSVVGGVLEVACSGGVTVRRLDKLTGAPIADHPTVTFKGGVLADLECDPVTFAGSNIDAVWSKIAATDQVQAFRVPGGTCGLPATAVIFAPAACPEPVSATLDPYRNPDGTPKDSDGDGLWDCWEDPARWPDQRPGIDFDGDGTRDVTLCALVDTDGDGIPDATECADPTVKNVFVEIDYMQNPDGSKSHRPDPLALLAVRTSFANAPVDPLATGGFKGVRVHFLVDEAIPHTDSLALEPCTIAATSTAVDFDVLKSSFFGLPAERSNVQTIHAKRFGFRYMLFAHNLVGSTASGCSEIPGDDATITLGSFGPADPTGHKHGTTDQQAGTVMHELGHLLGLRHGGADNFNCKPNYLSVMNYSRQFTDFITNRRLDYSRDELPGVGVPLDETHLLEVIGIGTPSVLSQGVAEKTVHSASNTVTPLVAALSSSATTLDWNNDGSITSTVPTTDSNRLLAAGCDGSGTVLAGFNDWQKLQFNARASLDFAGGVHTDDVHAPDPCPVGSPNARCPDKTSEQEQASFEQADADGDGVRDSFACGTDILPGQLTPCAIDIKPGTNPKQLSKGNEANVSVAILATADFDPTTQLLRETLTLNEFGVKLNSQGRGTCNNVRSTKGRQDLVCQFPADALPLGSNYAILEGKLIAPQCVKGSPCDFRARDFIIVVK